MGVLLALTLTLAGAGADAAPQVALRALARTPGVRIRLVDVIETGDLARVDPDLLRTDLGRSPSAGFGRRLDRRAIEAAVPEGVLRFTGPDEVLVQTDVVRLEPRQVIGEAERALREALYLPYDAEMEVARSPGEVQLPRGREGLELVARVRGTPEARGNVSIDVEVRVDGRVEATLPVAFLIRTFADLPVLVRDVARGEALGATDVEYRRVETTRLPSVPADDASALIGLLARRPLRAGAHLADRDFEQPVLVRRNQPVTLAYVSGALRVESFGLARADGALGDVVKVENLKTRKLVYGRVTAPGVVEMNP